MENNWKLLENNSYFICFYAYYVYSKATKVLVKRKRKYLNKYLECFLTTFCAFIFRVNNDNLIIWLLYISNYDNILNFSN